MPDLTSYQQNVAEYPFVAEIMAERLGVTPGSLCRLGLGFAPAIKFSKGVVSGLWVFPERDAQGEVVGAALRTYDGRKLALPGKRGLTFEHTGRPAYRPGPHNWVRSAETDAGCPVCGKSDGCLLAAESPDDPAAVICCRHQSPIECGIGWLHVRRPEGDKRSGDVLAGSDLPVVVVEGASDVAAALDLGAVAVGRPTAQSKVANRELVVLLRGRRVCILGENDAGAGVAGMNATAIALLPHAREVRTLLPPEGAKDLRDWLHQGLTPEKFAAALEAALPYAGEVLPDDALEIAKRWLATDHTEDQTVTLRRYNQRWLAWHGGKYAEVPAETFVRGGVWRFLDGKTVVRDDRVVPSTRNRVSDVVDAMSHLCGLPHDQTPPCWLDGAGPNPSDLIAFPNGVLDVRRFLEGDTILLPPTPRFFTLNARPYDFDPEARCPLWIRWLDETLVDPLKIRLLQEWVGYCMVPDIALEKMMLVVGRSGAGKGTCLEVMRAVLGQDSVATTSFTTLAGEFGRAPLIGKLAAVMPDARLPRRVDAMRLLEVMLAMVGGDRVDVNRKMRDILPDERLYCRFTIMTNELPELPDHAQALMRRLLLLHFDQTFAGREDTGLKASLPKEAPGVALWALDGLRRLRKNGKFTIPASSAKLVEEFRYLSSPVASFIDECCEVGPENSIPQHELWEVWLRWCRDRAALSGSRRGFEGRLIASLPDLTSDYVVDYGRKRKTYHGVDLSADARSSYLGVTA